MHRLKTATHLPIDQTIQGRALPLLTKTLGGACWASAGYASACHAQAWLARTQTLHLAMTTERGFLGCQGQGPFIVNELIDRPEYQEPCDLDVLHLMSADTRRFALHVSVSPAPGSDAEAQSNAVNTRELWWDLMGDLLGEPCTLHQLVSAQMLHA